MDTCYLAYNGGTFYPFSPCFNSDNEVSRNIGGKLLCPRQNLSGDYVMMIAFLKIKGQLYMIALEAHVIRHKTLTSDCSTLDSKTQVTQVNGIPLSIELQTRNSINSSNLGVLRVPSFIIIINEIYG